MAVNYPKKLGASHRQDGGSSEGAVGEFAQGLGRLLERVEADTIGNILAYEPEASATVIRRATWRALEAATASSITWAKTACTEVDAVGRTRCRASVTAGRSSMGQPLCTKGSHTNSSNMATKRSATTVRSCDSRSYSSSATDSGMHHLTSSAPLRIIRGLGARKLSPSCWSNPRLHARLTSASSWTISGNICSSC